MKNKSYLAIGGVMLIGLILRLYHLTAISLWHDEAFSALLIKYSWGEMMHRIALDVHPPFYYIVLRLWNYLFGNGLFSLRFFSLFFGMLTIYFAYLFVKKSFKNETLAIICALFIAVNPFLIQFSQEARMYTLGSFLIILSSWLIIRAIESKKTIDWVLYGIVAGLTFLTHYFLMFSVAGQGIFLVGWMIIKNRDNFWQTFKKIFWAYLTCLMVFLPWVPTFIKQFNQVQDSYWIPPMSDISIPSTFWKMLSGWDYWTGSLFIWIFGAIFAIIFVYILFVKKNISLEGKWFTVACFIVPFVLAILLSYKRSLYLDRYFIFSGLFYLIIWALFVLSLINKKKQLGYILVALITIFSLYFYTDNWRRLNVSDKPGMDGASKLIIQNALSADKIVVDSSFIYFTFKYYNKTQIKPLLLTPGLSRATDVSHFAGNALLSDFDLESNLSLHYKSGDRVWILWTTGFGAQRNNLPTNWRQIDEHGFEDVYGYRGWIVATLYEVN